MRIKKISPPFFVDSHVFADSDRLGQVFIEMIVALGVLTMALVSSGTLLARALGLNRSIADSYTATYLASEGIEVVKNIIDTGIVRGGALNNWDYIVGMPVTGSGDFGVAWNDAGVNQYNASRPLLYDSVSHTYGYTSGVPTGFTRTVHITRVASGNEIAVSSTVRWVARGDVPMSVVLENHFYNWKPQP